MSDDKKTFGRLFTEGLAFGAGLVVAGGLLKTVWNWLTHEVHEHDDDDDEIYALNEDEKD